MVALFCSVWLPMLLLSLKSMINLARVRHLGFLSAQATRRATKDLVLAQANPVSIRNKLVTGPSWPSFCRAVGSFHSQREAPHYWDNNGPGSPNGVWDVTSSFWSQNIVGGAPITPCVNGSNAVFSATGLNATGNFTVTLATNVLVGDLTYTGGGLGSTLQIAASPATNTITIAASPMHVMVDPFTTLVVAANIAGAGGQLVLEGPSPYL